MESVRRDTQTTEKILRGFYLIPDTQTIASDVTKNNLRILSQIKYQSEEMKDHLRRFTALYPFTPDMKCVNENLKV